MAEIKTTPTNTLELKDYFDIKTKKIGHLYKNGIIIQDNLILTKNTKEIMYYKTFFSHSHNIHWISEDVNIISPGILVIETNIPNKENVTVQFDDSSFTGKIISIDNFDRHSLISMISNENTEYFIKTNNYVISQSRNEEKEMKFFIKFNDYQIDKSKQYIISIFYTLLFKSIFFNNKKITKNDDIWSFKHFLYINNRQNINQIQETNHSLNVFTFDTKAYINPLYISSSDVIFNVLNLSEKELNISRNDNELIMNRSNQEYQPQMVVQESENQPMMLERAPKKAYLRQSEQESVISDMTQPLKGKIRLNNDENIMLVFSQEKIKGKIYNYSYVNTNMTFQPNLNNDEFTTYTTPHTVIVFVENYFNNKVVSNQSVISPISPGKLTIYGKNNEVILPYDPLNTLMLTTNTKHIDLGPSRTLIISTKLLKIETHGDYNSKWFLFRIKNMALHKSIVTLIFDYVESINIISSHEIDDTSYDINIDKIIHKNKETKEFITNELKDYKIFIDIPLNKKSILDVIIYVKMKI